ncbi:hypothetical protein CBR_g50699 [Chara braunii]|uniref:Uncharacterized protein n=1 Tax=Chara braunii TaxID=69332 RepID=A0A388K5P5_CHABU|nr:hypothetical protein CBR_g50699 [Chara braunii]|eukprot:GBG65336.1 hypothetical protein CBR_g50699 [Chara braunii]
MCEGLPMSAGEIEEDGRKQITTKSEGGEEGRGAEETNGENDGGTSSNGSSQVETGSSSGSRATGVREDVASREKNTSRQAEMPQAQGSPQQTANIIRLTFFWWLNGLLWQGYKQPLEEEDLWPLMPRDSSSFIRDRFETTVCKENANGIPNGRRLSLASQLFLTFKLEIVVMAILRLASDALLLFPSLLLNAVLLYMDYDVHRDKARKNFMFKIFGRKFGLYAAAGLFIIPFLRTLAENHYYVRAFILGNRVCSTQTLFSNN